MSSWRDVWNLMNFLTLGKSMMFQNSSTSQRKCLSCPLWSNSSPPDGSIATLSASTCDISQLLSLLFLLNLPLSIMSTLYEVVFNLNATCCVISVRCWHFYSDSLNATPANRWQCSIFIRVSCHQLGPSHCSVTYYLLSLLQTPVKCLKQKVVAFPNH